MPDFQLFIFQTAAGFDKAFKTLCSYFPSSVPTSVPEFKEWSDSIIELVGPMADVDSMKFALASQLIHLGPQSSSKPKQYFVRSLRKAAANQVSSYFFQEIKLKQQEAAKAATLAASEMSPDAAAQKTS